MHRGPGPITTKPMKTRTLRDVRTYRFGFFFLCNFKVSVLLEAQCFFRQIFRVYKTVLGFITFSKGFLLIRTPSVPSREFNV